MFPKGISFFFCDFETTGVDVNDFNSNTYPIELGYILADDHLNIIDTNDFLIRWDWMKNINSWNEVEDKTMIDAYKIHNIELENIKNKGIYPPEICKEIKKSLAKRSDTSLKSTIISDNAYFETFMLHKLFNNYKDNFPFHYTSWDINVLVKSTNIEKTKEHSHRALDDAADMYVRVIRSLEKIGYFDVLREKTKRG